MYLNRAIDAAERGMVQIGLAPVAGWSLALQRRRLYAGKLYRGLPQFRTHVGLTPFWPSPLNIPHDVREPLPLPDASMEAYQSEDVFEHIELASLPAVLEEIHRVLAPGGLFRLSLPDYGCDILRERSVYDESGALIFDPDGGGRFVDGQVVDGGHLWFPTFEVVKSLFDASPFTRVEHLHYTAPDGASVLEPIDYAKGHIQRTPDHDARVQAPRRALSIVVDAYKA